MIDKETLIQSAIQAAPPPPRNPKCPACKHDPLNFLCNTVATGAGHVVAVIWCGNCGHTLQTQFVGNSQPQTPRILMPQ